MNRHFDDARYYFGRGFEHLAAGVAEELRPLENRVRRATGREERPEPKRLERVQRELAEFEARAEGEGRRALRGAREQIRKYRSRA